MRSLLSILRTAPDAAARRFDHVLFTVNDYHPSLRRSGAAAAEGPDLSWQETLASAWSGDVRPCPAARKFSRLPVSKRRDLKDLGCWQGSDESEAGEVSLMPNIASALDQINGTPHAHAPLRSSLAAPHL